jgi:hypothetical protein
METLSKNSSRRIDANASASFDLRTQVQVAQCLWGKLSRSAVRALKDLLIRFHLSVVSGDYPERLVSDSCRAAPTGESTALRWHRNFSSYRALKSNDILLGLPS